MNNQTEHWMNKLLNICTYIPTQVVQKKFVTKNSTKPELQGETAHWDGGGVGWKQIAQLQYALLTQLPRVGIKAPASLITANCSSWVVIDMKHGALQIQLNPNWGLVLAGTSNN